MPKLTCGLLSYVPLKWGTKNEGFWQII